MIMDGVIEITIPDPNCSQAFAEINKKILLIQSQIQELGRYLSENEKEKASLELKLASLQETMNNKKVRSLFKIDDSLLKQEISGCEKRIAAIKLEIENQKNDLA